MIKVKFSDIQLEFLSKIYNGISPNVLEELFQKDNLNEDDISQLLFYSNALYRSGIPIITDEQYDYITSMLKDLNSQHPYLFRVEKEVVTSKTVVLPERMLSTEKVYNKDGIDKWYKKILKAGNNLGIAEKDIYIRVTPKLDGYAAYDDGHRLYTRGDGLKGQDITRAFDRGLKIENNGERGLGPGEIVTQKSYFDKVLSEHFENSRNIQAAIIAEKNIDNNIQRALDLGACVFYPFAIIKNITQQYDYIRNNFDQVIDFIMASVDFDIDGVIFEAINSDIKKYMGATRHHHKWQVAFKKNHDTAEVEVIKVTPQTSRTGRVSPVAELIPTKLSGVTISRVTVHNYKIVKNTGVGPGSIVQLVRSGLVIPKIERVLKKVDIMLPSKCPSCGTPLEWEGDHLICENKSNCPAQKENKFIHFFKTLGNNDGFGPKVIQNLCASNIKFIHDIYQLTYSDFIKLGFKDKTSKNLLSQLKQSREIEIEDWRFLSAFGVSRLGGGNCEKLLRYYPLSEIFNLSRKELTCIDGFAESSADSIILGLKKIKDEFMNVFNLGFNLIFTEKQEDHSDIALPLADLTIVFTGKMYLYSRIELEKQAKLLGASISKSITSKVDYLVTGDNVGALKLEAAKKRGIKIISENEYNDLIRKKSDYSVNPQ